MNILELKNRVEELKKAAEGSAGQHNVMFGRLCEAQHLLSLEVDKEAALEAEKLANPPAACELVE